MTEIGVATLAYLALGIGTVIWARYDRWIETIRWWHVLFWPAILIGYGLILLGFWMAGSDRR